MYEWTVNNGAALLPKYWPKSEIYNKISRKEAEYGLLMFKEHRNSFERWMNVLADECKFKTSKSAMGDAGNYFLSFIGFGQDFLTKSAVDKNVNDCWSLFDRLLREYYPNDF